VRPRAGPAMAGLDREGLRGCHDPRRALCPLLLRPAARGLDRRPAAAVPEPCREAGLGGGGRVDVVRPTTEEPGLGRAENPPSCCWFEQGDDDPVMRCGHGGTCAVLRLACCARMCRSSVTSESRCLG